MGAQDQTEKVLRDLHIFLSESEMYEGNPNRLIVDKKELLLLLKELAVCLTGLMDEYELTKQSKERAERERRKAGEDIIADARKKAEDVYAASILYTEGALRRVTEIMDASNESVKKVFAEMEEALAQRRQEVVRDKNDLESHLQDLQDTDKYMSIIEERNKKLAMEKQSDEDFGEPSYAKAPKPEIRINEDYFAQHGISFEPFDDVPDFDDDAETKPAAPEIKVNLDSEYFKWKNGQKP